MLGLRAKLRIIIKSRCFQFLLVFSVFLLLVVTTQDNLFGSSIVKRRRISKSSHFNKLLPVPGKVISQNVYFNALELRRPVKILCYILLSRSKLRTALLIKETWGAHCDDLLFFGGYDYPDLPVTYLNITEGYENLWGKAKAALLYLREESRFKDFQYFLKADDDTFVIVENLRKFLHNLRISVIKPVWLGFRLKHEKMLQGYMSGGAGYVFNYRALEKVTNVLKGTSVQESSSVKGMSGACNIDGEYGIEDLELGKCFLAAGVGSINTNEEDGRDRFLPLSYDDMLNGAISSYHWIWRQAWNGVRTGEKCCSQDLISMHEVSPSQIKLIYYLLYKTHVWKGRKDILESKD